MTIRPTENEHLLAIPVRCAANDATADGATALLAVTAGTDATLATTTTVKVPVTCAFTADGADTQSYYSCGVADGGGGGALVGLAGALALRRRRRRAAAP